MLARKLLCFSLPDLENLWKSGPRESADDKLLRDLLVVVSAVPSGLGHRNDCAEDSARYNRIRTSHGLAQMGTDGLIRKPGTQEIEIECCWTGQNQQNGQNETNVLKLARLQPCSALHIAPLPSISEIPFLDSENSVHHVEKTSVISVFSLLYCPLSPAD